MLIRTTVNGELVERDVEPRRRLVDFIREDLGLVGANVGCGHGVCGACTVLFDGQTVKSCVMFAVQADAHELTTIEGVSPPEGLSDVQAAFKRNFSIQCGFCAPGTTRSSRYCSRPVTRRLSSRRSSARPKYRSFPSPAAPFSPAISPSLSRAARRAHARL